MNVVTLLSGGADSSTLLFYLMYEPSIEIIAPLAINYHQRHKKELESAKKIVTSAQDFLKKMEAEVIKKNLKAKFKKKVLDLRVEEFPLGVFGGSPLVDTTKDVPSQDEQKQATTVVPFRNTILATLGASYAKSLGYSTVVMGPTYEDLANYPDCRPIFWEQLMDTLRLGDTMHDFRIMCPFNELKKPEIYAMGAGIGVPFKDTWTCYKGEEKACGVCDSCKERIAGFAAIGVNDPVEYEPTINWEEEFKKYPKK